MVVFGTAVFPFPPAETGQGSALSADAHHGVDQQTLEARAYAVARRFSPLLVRGNVQTVQQSQRSAATALERAMFRSEIF